MERHRVGTDAVAVGCARDAARARGHNHAKGEVLPSLLADGRDRIAAAMNRLAVAMLLTFSALAGCAPTKPATTYEYAPPPAALLVANTEIGQLIDGAPRLVVAGQRLNAGLLRSFYARHGFEPIWTNRQAQADALVNAVLHAGDDGLSPELFHADLLRQRASLPPLDRDLVLSDAFLSYADALARGAMPIERRSDDEALTPEPIDVAAALDTAIDSPDPAAAIEALAPTTPTYQALRQALQRYRSEASAGDSAATNRLRQIEVNLERQRWLPRRLPADRVWVNAADARLVLYLADRPVFTTRVIVGEDDERNQSPEFRTIIDGILFNPPWNIPEDIARDEILPKTTHDPNYLTRHNMVMLPDGGLQQLPGPNSGLGLLKFEMDNRFGVYLHDTPSKNLFSREDRRISHGCIRVQNPRDLAALLMQQPIDTINQAIAAGSTTRVNLPAPVPVFVVYQTAFVDSDGTVQFRPDVYHRDAEVWAHLYPVQNEVAEREPGQPRG
jgi:murein L,D-transpeptidase YcbB/YkuD